MHVDAIVDASVLAAALFNEKQSGDARAWLSVPRQLAAPELLRVEMASIAAKKVWRGDTPAFAADKAVPALDDFVTRFVGGADLAEAAYRLARDHKFSAYDASYVALAIKWDKPLVTLDEKLIARAEGSGIVNRVHGLR